MTVYEKIAAQQKGHENTDIWVTGQVLVDILHGDPALEDIVDKDLDVEDMSIVNATKRIKAWSDAEHRKTKEPFVFVPPDVWQSILREFYGLPARGASEPAAPVVAEDDELPDFADFL